MRSATTKAAYSGGQAHVTDEVADWSGDWVVNEIAARVDRAGPRPVSEDH
jgi:hypothetical protein